jgi:hypothetical protein
MAKRLIDTELFDDPWFMDLSLSGKTLWVYCITKCDHAGILKWNDRLIQFQTGVKDIQTVKGEIGDRLVTVSKEYIFIPKFFEFQYPSYPEKKFKAAESAVEILRKFNLIDNTTETVKQVSPDTYSNSNSNGNGKKEKGVRGKSLMRTSGITLNMVADSFTKSDDIKMADPSYYYNTALAWSDSKGEMRVDWIATIANFARRDIKDGKLKLSNYKQSGGTNLSKDPLPDDYGTIRPGTMTREEWKQHQKQKANE